MNPPTSLSALPKAERDFGAAPIQAVPPPPGLRNGCACLVGLQQPIEGEAALVQTFCHEVCHVHPGDGVTIGRDVEAVGQSARQTVPYQAASERVVRVYHATALRFRRCNPKNGFHTESGAVILRTRVQSTSSSRKSVASRIFSSARIC